MVGQDPVNILFIAKPVILPMHTRMVKCCTYWVVHVSRSCQVVALEF